jgi:hypothetical protein
MRRSVSWCPRWEQGWGSGHLPAPAQSIDLRQDLIQGVLVVCDDPIDAAGGELRPLHDGVLGGGIAGVIQTIPWCVVDPDADHDDVGVGDVVPNGAVGQYLRQQGAGVDRRDVGQLDCLVVLDIDCHT